MGQQLAGLDHLRPRREVAGGHQQHLVDLAGHEGVGHGGGHLAGVGEGGALAHADEGALDRLAPEAEVGLGLLAHREEADLHPFGRQLGDQPLDGAEHRGVVGTRQAPVGHDGQHHHPAALLGLAQQLGRRRRVAPGRLHHDAGHAGPVGAVGVIRFWARTICEAAISSIALVIFFVDWTLRMRRRRTRSWPPAIGQSTFPVSKPSRNDCRLLSSSASSGSLPVVRM